MKMLKNFAIVLLLSGSCGICAMDIVEVLTEDVDSGFGGDTAQLFDRVTGERLVFRGVPLGSARSILNGDIDAGIYINDDGGQSFDVARHYTQNELNCIEEGYNLGSIRSLERVAAEARMLADQASYELYQQEKAEMKRRAGMAHKRRQK